MFCRRLSEAEGVAIDEMAVPAADSLKRGPYGDIRYLSGYRLPIEAEWETACRAGTSTPRFFGFAPELLPTYCCFMSNSDGQLRPAGSLLPNQWGLFDMLGNVAEWCYNAEPKKDQPMWTTRYSTLVRYMVRGNEFLSNSRRLRAANRGTESPEELLVRQGFRIACTLEDGAGD